MKLAAVAVSLVIPALAHADALRVATATYEDGGDLVEPPGLTPVIVEIAPPAPPPLSAIAAQTAVVSAQRNLISGTALTVPQGQVELSARSAIVVNGLSIAAGLTSTTEIWGDAYTAIEGEGTLYGVGLKQVLARGEGWQLAATGSFRGGSDGGSDETLATLGGVLTACSEDCRVMASGGVSLLMADDEQLPLYSAAVSVGSPTTRLIGEVLMVRENDDLAGIGFLGMRFGSRKFAADLGLAKLLEDGDDFVLPMLSISSRL